MVDLIILKDTTNAAITHKNDENNGRNCKLIVIVVTISNITAITVAISSLLLMLNFFKLSTVRTIILSFWTQSAH